MYYTACIIHERKCMKLLTIKQLIARLTGLAGIWFLASLLLRRTGFSIVDSQPFDWQGLLFMSITITIAVYVFRLLKQSQRHLKYNYVFYGLAWIVPVIIIGSLLASSSSSLAVLSNDPLPDHCSPGLLPSVCRLVDGPTGRVTSVTYQSGYGVTVVALGAVGYSLYYSLKKRIKGHRREDLFQ